MQTAKKKSKTTKNNKKDEEKQTKKVKTVKKVSKEEKEKQKQQETREKELQDKINEMRHDLQKQLVDQNKYGSHFDDMIENYLFYVRVIDELKRDIKDNGIRYKVKTGNGYTTEKPNESLKNITVMTAEMRKILQDLNLKEPEASLTETEQDTPEEGEGDDLL